MNTEQKTYSEYNCLNQSLAFLVKKQESDMKWLTANCFSIEYSTKLDKELIYKKLRVRQAAHYTKFCEIVYGMKFEEIRFCENIFDDIKRQLEEGKAVLVGFDSYYAPWIAASGKTHVFHFCLITDVNGDDLMCFDAYMNSLEIKWKKELFLQAVKTGYYITLPDTIPIIECNTVIKLMIQNMTENTIRKNYDELICDLRGIYKIEQLFENIDPKICEIIVVVKRIAADYERLTAFFETIDIRFKAKILRLCMELQKRWELITNTFLRMILRKKINENSILSVINLLEENREFDIQLYKILMNNTK